MHYRCCSYSDCSIRNWIIVIMSVTSAVLPVSVVLGILYGPTSDDVGNPKQYYGLTDKFIPTYNRYFCQNLQAASANMVSLQSNATLYLLNAYPSLTDIEGFNFTGSAAYEEYGDYKQWNFNLNSGSKVTFNACYQTKEESGYVYFYLVQGGKNFNRWKDIPIDDYSVVGRILFDDCNTITYTVTKSDTYYFIFYAYIRPDYYFSLKIDFQFLRTVYHVDQFLIVQNCSFLLDDFSSCSLAIPMASGYTALLSLNTSIPIDYSTKTDISIRCQPRVWFYVVIAICAMVPFIAIVICAITFVCIKIKNRKRKYALLAKNNTANSAKSTTAPMDNPVDTTLDITTTKPPNKMSATGGYGATSTASSINSIHT